jgi:hypothetical protein
MLLFQIFYSLNSVFQTVLKCLNSFYRVVKLGKRMGLANGKYYWLIGFIERVTRSQPLNFRKICSRNGKKSLFCLALKKHTGMTPKEFISSTGDKSAVFK